ncbi:MAG: glycine cleavage system protein H [Anaerolineae bacterium]|nr:glycine cleavage system protein H [Anaerolineae bacterium]
MTIYYGCDIPEDLYFHPDQDCWVRFEQDGSATMGMTDIAQTMAGKLLYIKFKDVGRKIKAGKNAATIESAKWVGPFVIPFEAEILETNEHAFTQDILIANKDPYGSGWLVKVKPADAGSVRQTLLTGQAAVEHFQKKINANDIRCFRCAD